MLKFDSGVFRLLPKLFWTIFSNEPRMDLGSSPPAAAADSVLECDRRLGGETASLGLIIDVGGETEGDFLFAAPAAPIEAMEAARDGSEAPPAAEAAKSLLRSAIAFEVAEDAAAGDLCNGGPTHWRICSTNKCMTIFSPHFSHEILPAGSLGFI